MPAWLGAAALVLTCLPYLAVAAEGDVRLGVQAGYDTNVRRDYDQLGPVSDGFASLVGSASGRVGDDRVNAAGSYDLGLRAFPGYGAEDTVAQAAAAQGTWALTRNFSLGLDGHGKDRRGGDRDYSDLVGGAFAELFPTASWSIRAEANAHRFLYWDNFAYSFGAPEVGTTVRFRVTRRHSVFASGELGFRSYNDAQRDAAGDVVGPRRDDTAWGVSAGYAFRGPFLATLAYGFFSQRSNSFGQSLQRHRVTATAGVRLPWKLFLLADGALQLARYPDGIYLAPTLFVLEDSDNTSSLTVKLARPLDDHFELEAAYGIHYATLPNALQSNHLPLNLTYLRQLAWLGATWRL